MMLFTSTILSLMISLAAEETPHTELVWHWEDQFNTEEKQKIVSWLTQVSHATDRTLGSYPFELHLFIHRRDGSREPVPWASTRRHSLQGIDFHIDPDFSLQDFLSDWTAPHEISHLSLPFLGSEQAWFAEGYASFMQYQIMETMGILTGEDVDNIYSEKIERCRSSYRRSEDFVTVAKELKNKNRYPEMYWGGASYFMQINRQLENEQKQNLTGIIKEYLLCCRMEDEDLDELIKSMDELTGESLFKKMLHRYQSAPASEILESFPEK